MNRSQQIIEALSERAVIAFHVDPAYYGPGAKVPVYTAGTLREIVAMQQAGDGSATIRGLHNMEDGKAYGWDGSATLHYVVERKLRIMHDPALSVIWRAHIPLREVTVNTADFGKYQKHVDSGFFLGFKVVSGTTDF